MLLPVWWAVDIRSPHHKRWYMWIGNCFNRAKKLHWWLLVFLYVFQTESAAAPWKKDWAFWYFVDNVIPMMLCGGWFLGCRLNLTLLCSVQVRMINWLEHKMCNYLERKRWEGQGLFWHVKPIGRPSNLIIVAHDGEKRQVSNFSWVIPTSQRVNKPFFKTKPLLLKWTGHN